MRTRFFVLWLLTISAVLPFFAHPVSAQEDVIRFDTYEPMRSLNPYSYPTNPIQAYNIMSLVYEPLMQVLPNGTIKPWVATSWNPSPDGLTLTVRLDPRAKWSDGKPLTARDVKFTFENKQISVGLAAEIIKSVEVIDDHTVRFIHSFPTTWWATQYAQLQVFPAHIWQNSSIVGSDPTKYTNSNPVGSGPYQLKRFAPAENLIQFEIRSDYWKTESRPHIGGIIYTYVPDENTRVLELKKGDVQGIPRISPAVVATLVGDPNIRVWSLKPRNVYFANLHFNTRLFPTNITTFRQAINLAIPRQEMIDTTIAGFGVPMPGPVMMNPYLGPEMVNQNAVLQGMNASRSASGQWTVKDALSKDQRLTEAGKLLDSIGFKRGPDGFRVSPAGQPFAIKVTAASRLIHEVRGAEYLKVTLDQLGIKTNLEIIEYGSWVGKTYAAPDKADWNLNYYTFFYQTDPQAVAVTQLTYVNGKPNNFFNPLFSSGYFNKQLNDLLGSLFREPDAAKRNAMTVTIQEILARDLPATTLFSFDIINAERTDKYEGWISESTGLIYNDLINYPYINLLSIISLRPKAVEQAQVRTVTEIKPEVREVQSIPLYGYAIMVALVLVAAASLFYTKRTKKAKPAL